MEKDIILENAVNKLELLVEGISINYLRERLYIIPHQALIYYYIVYR